MFLSPAEIKQQQLREKRGAYEREDVDALIDNVIGSYQHVWLERDRLKARVEELESDLARTKELLETVYTEEVFFPIIDKMGDRLKDEVAVRAELTRQNPKQAADHLRRNLDSLKDHLTKRRKFLLDQAEIKAAGKFDRSLLSWNEPVREPIMEVGRLR